MAQSSVLRGLFPAIVLLAAAAGVASAQTDRPPTDHPQADRPRGTATEVDTELVLAVDISMSMDPDEQRLQREGYVAALRDPALLKAIQSGPRGAIAITYIEWAGPGIHNHLIPWRLIDGPATAEAFIDELGGKPYSRYRMTSITSALEFASEQFGTGPFRGARRVIDVSGDGANNSGGPVAPVRDRLVESGIIINGLPILLKPTRGWSAWDVPDLDRYYANCVIGGPGAFMVPITSREEFATATRQKLLLEISGLTLRPRVLPAQTEGPQAGYDCDIVQRNLRRW